jgi:hypothetical protein
MSRTVDLFVDSDQPLELVAAKLGELLGAQLRASPDRFRYVLHEGEVTAYLTEHDFLDDDDLPLSAFPYVLSAQVKGDGEIEQSPEAQCLRRVNGVWRQATGLSSLLVLDLEWPDTEQISAPASRMSPRDAGPSRAAPPAGSSGVAGSSKVRE